MFQKATKKQAKLRCAIFGASGSGKTYSALRIAKGIGGKTAVIDTEHYSASKYSDRFSFDVADLKSKDIDSYVETINGAAKAGYEVLIIDSLTHAWQELLQQVENIAKAKYRGNTWSAWSEGTPKQKKLINALLSYPGHIIATMRCKTEWSTESAGKGSMKPVRVALSPEQGKGIEYEFDLLIELSTDHMGNIIKDRTGKFQDKIIKCPDEEFGEELKGWLDDGVSPFINAKQLKELQTLLQSHEVDIEAFYKYFGIKHLHELGPGEFDKVSNMIKAKKLKNQPQLVDDHVIPVEGLAIEQPLDAKRKAAQDKINAHLNNITETVMEKQNEFTI